MSDIRAYYKTATPTVCTDTTCVLMLSAIADLRVQVQTMHEDARQQLAKSIALVEEMLALSRAAAAPTAAAACDTGKPPRNQQRRTVAPFVLRQQPRNGQPAYVLRFQSRFMCVADGISLRYPTKQKAIAARDECLLKARLKIAQRKHRSVIVPISTVEPAAPAEP